MTKTTLTTENLKEMSNDNDCLNAVKKLLEAKAEKDVIKPKVLKIQENVLKENNFYPDDYFNDVDSSEPIRDPKKTFLMNEHQFNQYYDKVYEEYSKNGFDVEYQKCPLLIAESNEIKAKNNLVNVCEKYTGIARNQLTRLEHLDEYIEILLQYLTQFITETTE